MIEINLAPEELRVKPRSENREFGIKAKYILYLITFTAAILVCAHITLAALFMVKNKNFHALNNKWLSMEQKRKELEDFNKEHAAISEDARLIRQLSAQRISWSEKLSELSLKLPSGIWFREVSVSHKNFILDGEVVSLEGEEMSLIRRLIDNLKNDPKFFKDFNSLELISAQKKTAGSFEVVDFVISGEIQYR